jgi:outer membrane protein OmpA-like peptidoglycan-associated protein/tetratricopeptide (TPR) repeat protein
MKKLLLLLFVSASIVNFAQDKSVPFDKSIFKERKDEFKEARSAMEESDVLYQVGPSFYSQAIDGYLKAYKFNPDNAALNYKIGNCYLSSNERTKSLNYFKESYALNPALSKDIHFKIGRGYHLLMEFDKAIKEFEIHLKKLTADDKLSKKETDKYIRECKTGKDMVKNPTRVWVDNLGKAINTSYPEYGALITADESVLIYTTRRPSETNKELINGEYMEDVFISHKNEDGSWSQATSISNRINTKEHDATAGFSPDGLTLFLYYNSGKDEGDLYQSKKIEDGWEKPKNMGKNINDNKSWDTGASLSYDGKKLYFVSNKPGGKGQRDIWESNWDAEKEKWGEAKPIEGKVNTEYEEVGVFMHPDGKTMYFSSNGHKGMGGYDIYSSELLEDGTWGEPMNIGYPVCTPDNDVFFSISASGKHGYYSSFREDGEGEKDIYMITFLGKEKVPLLSGEDNLIAGVTKPVTEELVQAKIEVSFKNLSILKGKVLDAETKKPVKSIVDLSDNTKNEKVSEFSTDAETGKFLISLPAGKNYGIAVKSEGYLFHSENFDVPADAGYKEYEKIIYMKKVKVGESIVLRNIFFDLDKYSLKPESKTELDRLLLLLEENPTLVIEISGHTDTRGSADHNKQLSDDRAKAVVDYLVALGIPRERFEHKGYGEEKPMISDSEIAKIRSKEEKEESHGMNRRTEFKIISN